MPVAAVLGWPLEQTLSPALHTAGYRAAGLAAWSYQARPTPPAALPAVLQAVRRGALAGVNLTTPHKRVAFELVDLVTAAARPLGAVNTVWRCDAGLVADNTDVHGALWAMSVQLGLRDAPAASGDAVLLGAGGMARAAAAAYRRLAGCRSRHGLASPSLLVIARDPARAAETAALAGPATGTVPWAGAAAAVSDAWLVIQATTLTATGAPLPGAGALRPGAHLLECNYGPAVAPGVAAAQAAGVAAVDGLGLLLAQAAVAFLRFTGRPADRGAMAAAVGLPWRW